MKRIVCFLLALVMVLGLIPATATTANAASSLSTSDDAINLLARFQGFEAEEYKVGDKTLIGYGTEVTPGTYKNAITESVALQLLKDAVKDIDKDINDFTKKNNRDLTQYQHDAIAIFSFGISSTAWLEGTGPLREAILHGKDADIIAAFAKNHVVAPALEGAGFQSFNGVMNRRLAEANLYLNGEYNFNAPANFTYVVLDMNANDKADAEGKAKDNTLDIVIGYDANKYPLLTEKPGANTDKEFLGWYLHDGMSLGMVRGEAIVYLSSATAGQLLVPKFAEDGKVQFANYNINTAILRYREVFRQALSKDDFLYQLRMDFFNKIGKLESNTIFKVSMETMIDGIKWIYGTGTDEDGDEIRGWVYYGELAEDLGESDKDFFNNPILATAKVTSNTLPVYEGATSDNDVKTVATLKKGDVVNVYEIKVEATESGNKSWGHISYVTDIGQRINGWINLVYTEVSEAEAGDDQGTVGTKGVIVNTDTVNVRQYAGVDKKLITYLPRGTEVLVVETKTVDGAQWGRVQWGKLIGGYTEGWVYMYYVQLDGAINDFGGENESSEPVLYTGVVTSNINLNVRKKPSATADKVDSLANGTEINIYEVTTTNGVKWGRIGEKRWVCLQYVNLTEVEQSTGSTSTVTSVQGTVTATTLDVLKNYNSNAEKMGSLKKGDVVTILEENTEYTTTGTRIWGRISTAEVSGWINLAYVDLKTVTSVVGGSSSNSSSSSTNNANGAVATVSNCISVNVREAAGATKPLITKLSNGTVINVYEQVTKDNAPWAKITWNGGANSGWVCMNYVTMNAGTVGNTNEGGIMNGTNSNTISATGVVNSNVDLNVRSIAGLNGIKLGALKNGAKVTVYEQASADGMIWGRIQYGNGSGWICMSYITVESASSTGKGVMGTIARCANAVNVRSAPGTNNALIAKINVGTRVEVFETRTYSNQLWGRVIQGWICMDYVLLDSELPPGTVLDATVPTTEATQATTAPNETVNKNGEIGFKLDATIQGEVTVYNSASSKSINVGKVNGNLNVDILALKNNGSELWGRIDQYGTAGWILMDGNIVTYAFTGYVNKADAPVYVYADTTSAVKGTLRINEHMTFTKVTTDGEDVYGWVEKDIYGWIPMDYISNTETDVIPVLESGDEVGKDATYVLHGTTFTDVTAYDVIGGSRILFKMKSGVKVNVSYVRFENGKIWGCVRQPGALEGWITGDAGEYGDYQQAWFDLTKINYSLAGTAYEQIHPITGDTMEVYVRSSMDNSTDEDDYPNNIVRKLSNGTSISICQLVFDGYGNLWARVTGNADAQLNGMYIMVKASASGVDGAGRVFVQTTITPAV